MYENLAIPAAFLFLYSLVSGCLDRTPFNGAIVYTAFGLVLGPLVLGFLNLNVDAEGLSTLAEVTLALVLFMDAAMQIFVNLNTGRGRENQAQVIVPSKRCVEVWQTLQQKIWMI